MQFPEKISPHYASKFAVGKNCPLRMQVEFSAKENAKAGGFRNDPVGDSEAEIESGILQKYKGRLLVMASCQCAMNCRFCFRRNMPQKLIENLPAKLSRILQKNKTIGEVILSGGDPLMLDSSELQTIFNAIPKRIKIRIHTRMPIAQPSRFTPKLQNLLKQLGHRLIFVAHVNHPNELDKKSAKIFEALAKFGATLLNQSVLLKDINDSAQTLTALSEKLFCQRVLPYYLHQLDKAQGAAHFEVPIKKAKQVFKELKQNLPGYLVPRFVREVKHAGSKIWV